MTSPTRPLSLRRAWPWVLTLLVVVFALYIGLPGRSLMFKPFAGADLLRLLGSLAVVALLVERTIEVSVGAWRGKVTEKLFSSAENAKLALISAPANVTLHETVVAKEAELVDYRDETKKLALRVAVLLGLLVASTGFRTLETLVTATGTGISAGLFRLLDLAMTAAVIGGGSEAVHRMVSTVTTYLDVSAGAMRGRGLETAVPGLVVPTLGVPSVTPGPPTR